VGLTAASRTRFHNHAVGDLTDPSKVLFIQETVIAAESAYGLAFFGQKGQCAMRGDSVA
jgi:hypothetical protein